MTGTDGEAVAQRQMKNTALGDAGITADGTIGQNTGTGMGDPGLSVANSVGENGGSASQVQSGGKALGSTGIDTQGISDGTLSTAKLSNAADGALSVDSGAVDSVNDEWGSALGDIAQSSPLKITKKG